MTATEWVLTLLLIVVPLITFFGGVAATFVAQSNKTYEAAEGHDFHCSIRACGVPSHCNCGAGEGVW